VSATPRRHCCPASYACERLGIEDPTKLEENVWALATWAGMSVELLKALGKGGTVTVRETEAALAPFEEKLCESQESTPTLSR